MFIWTWAHTFFSWPETPSHSGVMKKQFTFDHVRHEPSFNNQPDASWNVKKSGIKSQENGDPLVIRIVQVRSVVFFARTGKLESFRHIKTAVHPTETVQDVIVHTVFSLQKRRYSTDDIFKTKCNASLQMYIVRSFRDNSSDRCRPALLKGECTYSNIHTGNCDFIFRLYSFFWVRVCFSKKLIL